MKLSTLPILLAATLSLLLIGCNKDETHQYLYDHNPDLTSTSELCTQDNVNNYGSDTCIPQQLNSDGTVKDKN